MAVNRIINLSKDGEQAMIDNGIKFEDLLNFTEPDIMDLFKNFSDRFKVRQLIKEQEDNSLLSSSVPSTASDSSIACISDDFKSPKSCTVTTCTSTDTDSESACNVISRSPTKGSTPWTSESIDSVVDVGSWSAEELLEKKNLRSKPSMAQSFFHSLLRDSAKKANIWAKVPLLTDINRTKREIFFDSMCKVAPKLRSKKEKVWKRLGQQLQNRRKYLKDKSVGKRGKFTTKLRVHTCSNFNNEKKSQQLMNLQQMKPGDEVYLFNQSRKITLGNAIFLRQASSMFSEVIVKSISSNCNSQDHSDIELPEPVVHDSETITTLTGNLLKEKILWRTDRLGTSKKNEENLTTEIRPTSQKTAGKTVRMTKSSTDINTGTKKKTLQIIHPDTLQKSNTHTCTEENTGTHMKRTSNTNEPKSSSSAKKSKKAVPPAHMKEAQKTCERESVSAKPCEVGIFEWCKGSIYLGQVQAKEGELHVMNCFKPIGKINKNKELTILLDPIKVLNSAAGDKMTKLNRHDIVKDFNEEFCILKCALKLKNDQLIFDDETEVLEFIAKLQENFKKYISTS